MTTLNSKEQEPSHQVPRDSYDLLHLGMQTGALGYGLRFVQETESTMDIAATVGAHKTIVITDHQTQGRGRFERSWLDQPGRSVLMTVVEPFDANDPGPFSGLPSNMFSLAVCLALQEVTGNTYIKLRWPGDPVYNGKKLGGVLIENPSYEQTGKYPKLFGIGINANYENADIAFPNTDYGAISLAQACNKPLSKQEIVNAIMQKWASIRIDLRVMQKNGKVFDYYNNLWCQNSELLGKVIQIAGIDDIPIEGTVLDSPIGNGIILQTPSGEVREINSYDTYTLIGIKK